jgi:DNA-binding MarR family transcriptional regulator
MTSRTQAIEEFLSDLQSLKQLISFKGGLAALASRITPSQCSLLLFIEQHSGCSVKDAAHALGISSSATTQLADTLVESGYVLRKASEQDRRTVTLTLSKKSMGEVARMKRFARQEFINVFKVLNDTEFKQYILLTKSLITRSLNK